MPLLPESRAFLDACKAETPCIDRTAGIAAVRAVNDAREMLFDVVAPSMAAECRVDITTVSGASIALDIYTPRNKTPLAGVLLFLHGGGWVMCSPTTHANLCRYLCARAGVIGVNVGYRIAPEHPFPAAVDDAIVALDWAVENVDSLGGNPEKIVVAGDSAGGNLAALLAQRSGSGQGPRLAAQALLYPSVGMGVRERFDSWRTLGDGTYGISDEDAEWMVGLYLSDPPTERLDPRFSPILAEEFGRGPPALVVTAEFDPLRDEGREYARRLRDAGVPVEERCYPGTIHAFMSMAGAMPTAYRALDETADFIAAHVGAIGPINGELA